MLRFQAQKTLVSHHGGPGSFPDVNAMYCRQQFRQVEFLLVLRFTPTVNSPTG